MLGVSVYAVAALLAASVAWSGLDLLRKVLVAKVRPLALLFWLTTGSVPFFAVWAALEGRWQVAPGYVWPALGSLLFNVAANLAFFESVRISPLSVTIPLLSLTPAFAALAAVPLVGEWPGWRRGLGILLVVVGALVLNLQAGGREAQGRPEGGGRGWRRAPATVVRAFRASLRAFLTERGSLLMVLVAVLWSVAISCDKLAIERATPALHALVLFAGIGLAALLGLAAQRRLGDLSAVRQTPWSFPGALLVGTVALGLQFLVLQWVLVGVVETVKRGIGNTAAVVLGRAVFGEAITAQKVAAVVLMAAGVALVMLG